MRDIKFRAWDKNKKVMLDYGFVIFPDGKICDANEGDIGGDLEDIELMQYTGLKDKNGTDIYESDIVKWAGYKGKVEWVFDDKVKFEIWFFNNGFVVVESDGEWVNLGSKYEVIGNIYENPDLLK